MSELSHFDLVPLQMDPESKAISAAGPSSRALAAELQALNELHKSIINIETGHPVPPPPMPVYPKRSAAVTKLREQGNNEFRRLKYAEAIKFYTSGLELALQRPAWEPCQLVRDEVAALYANRAQAYMALLQWPEGAVDAEASVEAKRVGNAKAWWRRGRCLIEMNRLIEAKEWVGRSLELEGEEAELVALLKDINARLENKN
ncbi:hypothetical protein TD95_002793 [Thielaviopsis punctulata]|uniref:Translocation protein sec72 n=1 Tax=Thielaviopsis punctulata TaxID=72032 RepID=A0A0F4ZJX6_9PEZI|nr:hypothetical protein TD95_002793 [Thielaviopsis punctulata]